MTFRIAGLAWFDIVKSIRGTVLGWTWLFVKPVVYILAFWFALDVGLRAGSSDTSYPYILWLASGIIPWFAMSDMLTVGSDVYSRYPFLVARLRFPHIGISLFYCLSIMIIQLLLVLVFVLICLLCGIEFSVHVIQLPFFMILMLLFFTALSVMLSPLSAICKDIRNLVRAMVTPLFWFSGILFSVSSLSLEWAKIALLFDPVTFFANSYRAALCEGYWIWERPELILCFLGVFVVTVVLSILSYRRWHKVVPDVI